jgi:ornithine cyclodeaminase/alanine dehydrogenase-like protein (mu-crystallin family)
MIENPPALFEHTQPFVDSIDAVLAEAGEINQAVELKLLQPEIITELGKVILGEKTGRVSDHQVTYFKSVGIAVQDAMAARLALKNAKQLGLGQQVAW